jgi:DNA-binding FadR family transcriptional regulator
MTVGRMTEGLDVNDAPEGRVSLTEAVYQRLYADVMFGRLASGQRVTERALAAELGLSAAPVRAALARLDHDGLVTTLPRKGYRITPLTLKSTDPRPRRRRRRTAGGRCAGRRPGGSPDRTTWCSTA